MARLSTVRERNTIACGQVVRFDRSGMRLLAPRPTCVPPAETAAETLREAPASGRQATAERGQSVATAPNSNAFQALSGIWPAQLPRSRLKPL